MSSSNFQGLMGDGDSSLSNGAAEVRVHVGEKFFEEPLGDFVMIPLSTLAGECRMIESHWEANEPSLMS